MPKEPVVCPDGTRVLGSCEYFVVKELKLDGKRVLTAGEESYQALIVVEGELELAGTDFSVPMAAGETVFIPAGLGEYTLEGNATVLLTSNPV